MNRPEPISQSLPNAVQTVSIDDLEVANKSNPKMRERQTAYENALRSLVPGGEAQVFHLTAEDAGKDGKPSSRGLKLRISYAAKRLKLQHVIVGDATLKATNETVVYARIPADKA